MTEQEYWYRYEDVLYAAPLDEYDMTIVGGAYNRLGKKAPWYWTNERCFRTVRNMHPTIEYDPSQKGEGAHNALADAVFQVEHLFKIKNRGKKSA